MTLILTFGLELMMNNAMLVCFTANYHKVILENSLGVAEIGDVFVSLDRAVSSLIAFVLILALVGLAPDIDRPSYRRSPFRS